MSADQAPLRRGRKPDPDAEPRIRQAAALLLLERGYQHTTVDDIAAASGVGKATIYRRWPTKAELARDALTELLDIEIPDPDTGTLQEDLRQAYRVTMQFAATPLGTGFIRLAVSEASRDPEAAAIYSRYLDRRTELLAATLDRARDRGEPVRASVDPRLLMERLAGLLVVRALTDRPMPTVDEADALADLALHGVLGTAP
jgi:AcrR family transcriptional regulator